MNIYTYIYIYIIYNIIYIYIPYPFNVPIILIIVVSHTGLDIEGIFPTHTFPITYLRPTPEPLLIGTPLTGLTMGNASLGPREDIGDI